MRLNKINGKAVKDATEPLTFRVTPCDARKGTRADPMSCALARGLTKHGHAVSCRIGKFVAIVEFKNEVKRYEIAHEDRRKIDAFDNAHYFQPGTYTLKPPASWLRQEVMRKAAATRNGTSSRARSGKHVSRKQPMRHALRIQKEIVS